MYTIKTGFIYSILRKYYVLFTLPANLLYRFIFGLIRTNFENFSY